MTMITNKSKTLSRITRALGIAAVVGISAIATAGTADAGGKHKQHHFHGGNGFHFKFSPRRNHFGHVFFKGSKRSCHVHRFGRKGLRKHKKIRCHFHRNGRHNGIQYVR